MQKQYFYLFGVYKFYSITIIEINYIKEFSTALELLILGVKIENSEVQSKSYVEIKNIAMQAIAIVFINFILIPP